MEQSTSERMTRIPSVYSLVKLSTKERSYTSNTYRVNSSIHLWSCKDVVQWLRVNYFDKDVIKRFKKSKVDGAALLGMTVDRLKTDYGVTKVGQQKRIMMLICSDSRDTGGHFKSKSNSSICTATHIITVLYHKTAVVTPRTNDSSEGTVHRLFFNHVPTYRDFIQQLNKQLSNIKHVFYYDEQGNIIYVNNSESWYNYMDLRDRDSSVMLEVSSYDYTLLDCMDIYILVTDTDDSIVHCNTKLQSIVGDCTGTKYSTVICSQTNTILSTNGPVSISNIQTIPTSISSETVVYTHLIT